VRTDYVPEVLDEDQEDEDEEFGDFDLADDDDFDELTMESLFLPVTSLWQVLLVR
jgi:hypothetical protein